jgi:hypothetical protein
MTPNRNDSFVPLAPASPRPAGERREFRATVISQSNQAQTFRSVAAAVIPSGGSQTAHAGHGEPKVNLQREGNRVTGIHIQCSCGQVMELSCVYDAVPAAQSDVDSETRRRDAGGPRKATIPQPEPAKAAPGKICKDSGKDLPSSAAKKPKVPEKGRGTSAAKRRSA